MSYNYGGRVKINVEKFLDRKLNNKFKKFIIDNKDVVFTSNVDIKSGYNYMYTLNEDTNNPKWLFWEGDLIFIDELEG